MSRCPFAVWKGSPNFWPGRLPLESLVDHVAQGTLAGTDAWFNNPNSQASAHFEVGKNGDIHQYVDTDDSSWGNGALLKPDLSIPWIAQAFASKTYAEYWSRHPNRRTISIEHEGHTGEVWTAAMYASDLRLKNWLMEMHDFGQELNGHLLLGHHHFDSVNRARCPGTTWPRARLIQDLQEDDMPTQQEWDDFNAAYKLDIKALRDQLAGLSSGLTALRDAVRVDIRAVRESVAAHAATTHGGSGGVSEERVKEIVRELVAD